MSGILAPMAILTLFERQWATYRDVVDHDLMEHRALGEATAAVIGAWLAQRPAAASAPRLVDLGCGDLAPLAPLLRRLPLGSYTGVDLTAAVLGVARATLGPVPFPSHWEEADLLHWIQREGEPIDLLHAAFSIHHLSDPEKAACLQAARRRISPDGLFLWADVFREPGEQLEPYRQRYAARVREGWQPLSGEQREQVITHLCGFDRPADRTAIQAVAEAAGWRWRWAWQGRHRAEALAVLTPA
jgi:predicted TPR repeat methyltransferase